MEIEIYLISVIVWVVYAYFDGRIEAHYYDALVWSNRNHKDIHWMSVVHRALILILVGILTKSFSLPFALILIFSYVHNGFYYIERNKLDSRVYPEKFKASSTTSTSFFEFNYKDRFTMFLIGCILIFLKLVFLILLLWMSPY